MSESKDETKDASAVGISDDQLPQDLVPSEDNPLAEGLPDGETVGDLLTEGKPGDNAEEKSDDQEPGDQQAGRASSADSGDSGNG